VAEIAVVGIPDPKWGEIGRAFVALREDASLDVDALVSWGAERLARFKLPRDFVSVSSLPRTETGKVRKHLLNRSTRRSVARTSTDELQSEHDQPRQKR